MTRRTTESQKPAAPRPIGRRSDADVGDRRRPTAGYGGNGALGVGEGEEEVPEDGALTLDAWVCSTVTE